MRNIKIRLFTLALALTLTAVLFLSNTVRAATPDTTAAKTPDSAVELPNPLGDTYDPRAIIGNIIQGVLGLIGSIALVLFIWGGFEIMLSRGGPGIKKGQDTMVWAAIGLAVVFGSYAITNYIINKITSQ